MAKIKIIGMVVLVLALLGLGGGCAAEKVTPTEIKPCRVELAEVYKIYYGADVVVFGVSFNISNPNDFDVALDNFNYGLTVAKAKVMETQVLGPIFIPAGEAGKAGDAVCLTFAGLVGGPVFTKGIAAGQASIEVLPVWKAIGGNLPNPALKEMWDGLPSAAETIYYASGNAPMSGAGMRTTATFESSYKKAP